MATFTNQTTNLSNLSATLGLLCRALEGPLPPDNSKDEASKREEAEEFLDRVVERVDLVDEALMKSTEHLLPTLTSGRGDEPSRMTATELSQLLSLLHGANAEKIQHLNKALAGESPRNSAASSNKEEDQENNDLNTPPYHWSLGMPLDKVVETDNETDRYSYSSASVMKSPSVFNSTPSRRQPATPCSPCTPSIAELKLRYGLPYLFTLHFIMHFNSSDNFHPLY